MRKAKPTDVARLRSVARWYYREHLTKKQIAAKLGLATDDQRAINKMLQEADDREIVRIYIPEIVECGEEHEVRRRFGHLRELIIVPTAEHYADLLKSWGVAAAVLF